MASRLPTRDEIAAARRASYESIQAIIEEKKQRDDDRIDEDDDEDEDLDSGNGNRAQLEALLIKSKRKFLQGAWTQR